MALMGLKAGWLGSPLTSVGRMRRGTIGKSALVADEIAYLDFVEHSDPVAEVTEPPDYIADEECDDCAIMSQIHAQEP